MELNLLADDDYAGLCFGEYLLLTETCILLVCFDSSFVKGERSKSLDSFIPFVFTFSF